MNTFFICLSTVYTAYKHLLGTKNILDAEKVINTLVETFKKLKNPYSNDFTDQIADYYKRYRNVEMISIGFDWILSQEQIGISLLN